MLHQIAGARDGMAVLMAEAVEDPIRTHLVDAEAHPDVSADAAVSVRVIVSLLLAHAFAWLWMDPAAGLIGALVIASWAYGLIRDTGGILLDMNPDQALTNRVRQQIETDGGRLTDLQVCRLRSGHLDAVLSVVTGQNHRPEDYHCNQRNFPTLSHVTIEVQSN